MSAPRTLRLAPDLSLLPASEIEQLKERIRRGSPVDANGCWIWRLSTRNGYGQISVHDTTTYTHHLSYLLFVGPMLPGKQVCHACDVKRCNNPAHFFAGTQLDNIRDMWRKGRAKQPPVHRGLSNSNAWLTDQEVATIRELRDAGVQQRDVAKMFGCSQSTVWRIAHRIVRAS
jgi:hypothetical protein